MQNYSLSRVGFERQVPYFISPFIRIEEMVVTWCEAEITAWGEFVLMLPVRSKPVYVFGRVYNMQFLLVRVGLGMSSHRFTVLPSSDSTLGRRIRSWI
jgi:hypothetical protein